MWLHEVKLHKLFNKKNVLLIIVITLTNFNKKENKIYYVCDKEKKIVSFSLRHAAFIT